MVREKEKRLSQVLDAVTFPLVGQLSWQYWNVKGLVGKAVWGLKEDTWMDLYLNKHLPQDGPSGSHLI